MTNNFDQLPRIAATEPISQHFVTQLELIWANSQVESQLPSIPTEFLATPLTDSQLSLAAELLGPKYAKDGVAYQDLLLQVPVAESGEKMVSLAKVAAETGLPLFFNQAPFPDACGVYAGKPRIFWVRQSVADKFMRFVQLAQLLGLHVRVEDAFRPEGVQEGLFLSRVAMILDEHPDWIDDWDKVWSEARSKIAVYPILAGHKSGAAIDITLFDATSGLPLEIGNQYLAGGPKVTMHFPYLTQTEWAGRQLFAALTQASGFVGYPFEDWHISFGDIGAAAEYDAQTNTSATKKGYVASYGPIESFDPSTGEISIAHQGKSLFEPFYDRETLMKLLK